MLPSGGPVAPDHERLRRMRDRVDAQEAKLRRLRALRGQVSDVVGALRILQKGSPVSQIGTFWLRVESDIRWPYGKDFI